MADPFDIQKVNRAKFLPDPAESEPKQEPGELPEHAVKLASSLCIFGFLCFLCLLWQIRALLVNPNPSMTAISAYNARMTQRTNESWLADLRSDGQRQAEALEDLRTLILRGLPYALSSVLAPTNIPFAALAEDVVQETLLRVVNHLDKFEGRSAFTTWVQKIAVREALAELRHRRWKDAPLPDMASEEAPMRELPSPHPTPETIAERNDLLRCVERIILEELTTKQRQAVITLAIHGTPLEEAARQMNMKPNALYKLLHDARTRMKRHLAAEGLSPRQVLAAFASRRE